MAEETASGAAPAASPVTTPAPAATTTTPTPEPQAGDGQEHISLEEARKLRSEAANLRKRMKAYEEAEQAAEAAKLSEIERVTKQHAELQAQYEEMQVEVLEQRVYQSIAQQAGQHNFIIPADMIMRLLDWDEIEFDEHSGKPSNIDKLLEQLAKTTPDLIRQQQPPAQAGRPAIPAMNPGRANIQSPGNQPARRIPSWDEIYKRSGR